MGAQDVNMTRLRHDAILRDDHGMTRSHCQGLLQWHVAPAWVQTLNDYEGLGPCGRQSGQQFDNGPEVSCRGGHDNNGNRIHSLLARICDQGAARLMTSRTSTHHSVTAAVEDVGAPANPGACTRRWRRDYIDPLEPPYVRRRTDDMGGGDLTSLKGNDLVGAS